MRILLVSNYQPPHMGGIEFAAESLKRCWEEDGHAVTWLTTDIPRGGRKPATDIVRVRAANFPEDWWQINSPLPCPSSIPRICRLIAEHDVVNIHSLAPGLSTLALYLAVRRRKPVVATQHVGIIDLKLKALSALQKQFLCGVARWSVRRGVPLTFVGKAVRGWFVEKARLPADAVAMTPAGIDQKSYYFVTEEERKVFRKRWALRDDQLNVLFVGRFYEKKGLPLLRDIARLCPFAHFTFLGSGPISPAGWMLPNVEVLSFVPADQLRELYGSHDLFIMPSFGEGWPAVVPQAMACGLACLISEETFHGYGDDRGRFLVRPRELGAIVDTLEEAKSGKIALLADRKALADYAREHWDWMSTARIYLELFEEARRRSATAGR